MHRRIALENGDSVSAVTVLNIFDSSFDFIKRLPPGNLLPIVAGSFDRKFQAIGVFVNVLQSQSFRANVSARKRVEFVARD